MIRLQKNRRKSEGLERPIVRPVGSEPVYCELYYTHREDANARPDHVA